MDIQNFFLGMDLELAREKVKMFDHAFITEETSLASWSTASSDIAINDWSPEPEIDASDLQPAVVLQRLSPSVWPSSTNSENDIGTTDAIMQPVVMLERLPSIPTPSEINTNSEVIDQHISFQWTRTVLGPLPLVAESSQPSSITVSDNWSFQEMSATTTLQPVVILQRLPSPNWSYQQTITVTQPVVVLQRLNVPIPHLADNESFHEENTATSLKSCAMEPTVVLQRLSPFLQNSCTNFSTKEVDPDVLSLPDIPETDDTLPSLSTGQSDEFNSRESDPNIMPAEFPVASDTWSSSSSSMAQSDVEEQTCTDQLVKQPVIVLEQLPLYDMPSYEVTVGMSGKGPL